MAAEYSVNIVIAGATELAISKYADNRMSKTLFVSLIFKDRVFVSIENLPGVAPIIELTCGTYKSNSSREMILLAMDAAFGNQWWGRVKKINKHVNSLQMAECPSHNNFVMRYLNPPGGPCVYCTNIVQDYIDRKKEIIDKYWMGIK